MLNTTKQHVRNLPIAFILVWLVLPVAPAQAKSLVIVRSSALGLYDIAVKSFQKCFAGKGAGVAVSDVMLPAPGPAADAKLEEIRAKKPDVVLALGSSATRQMREKAKGVPTVFCMVLDPYANNITFGGVALDVRPRTQVEYIRKNFPSLGRIGVIYNPARNKETTTELKSMQGLVLVEVATVDQMDGAVTSLKGRADCLLMVSDPVLYTVQTASQLILKTLQLGVPLIAVSPAYVKAGALAGIYADYENNGCLAADLVQQVLGGEPVENLLITWAVKTKTAVNLIVAERLGIKVAQSAIDDAEEVIK